MIEQPASKPIHYEKLVDAFERALIHTLRKHSVADNFLDFWVPDADPVRGLSSMVDSARIAGLRSMAIRFDQDTLPPKRFPELEQALSKLCKFSLNIERETVLLRVFSMVAETAIDATTLIDPAKPTSWRPDLSSQSSTVQDNKTNDNWSTDDLPEFGDVHPNFRSALNAAIGNISFEGPIEPPPVELLQVVGRNGPVSLTFNIDPKTHVVHAARHTGAKNPSERAVLDLFCQGALNLPIQEVVDHVGLKVLHSLADKDKKASVPGVLLPINSGAPFLVPASLARRAYNDYCTQTGTKSETNFYYQLPSSNWQSLSAKERTEKVEQILRAFLQSEGLYPDDMNILRVDKNRYGYFVRVIVGFSDRISTSAKPNLMRLLEKRLRRDAEPEIDLVAERAKDNSPLRRLS